MESENTLRFTLYVLLALIIFMVVMPSRTKVIFVPFPVPEFEDDEKETIN